MKDSRTTSVLSCEFLPGSPVPPDAIQRSEPLPGTCLWLCWSPLYQHLPGLWSLRAAHSSQGPHFPTLAPLPAISSAHRKPLCTSSKRQLHAGVYLSTSQVCHWVGARKGLIW